MSPISIATAQELSDSPPKRPGETVAPDLDPVTPPWNSDLDLEIPAPTPDPELTKPGWTAASGSVVVDPGAKSLAVPGVPVRIVSDSRLVGDSRTVTVEVLAADLAGGVSPVGAALAFDVETAATDALWAGVEFEIDYQDVALIGGADLPGRLRLVQYSGCQLDADSKVPSLVCKASEVLDADNDIENRKLVFSLSDTAVVVPEDTRRLPSGAVIAIPAEPITVLAMTAGVSSDYGRFDVAPSASVLDYQVGLFTGSAELSYPIAVPAAEAGPVPG